MRIVNRGHSPSAALCGGRRGHSPEDTDAAGNDSSRAGAATLSPFGWSGSPRYFACKAMRRVFAAGAMLAAVAGVLIVPIL